PSPFARLLLDRHRALRPPHSFPTRRSSDLPNRTRAVASASSVADKVMAVLSAPFRLQDREVFVSTSIGIALYPHDGEEVSTLLRSEEHTSELQSRENLVCRLLLEKKKYTPE